MFFSLLAASIDGFITGFLLGGLGIKLRIKDVFSSFAIIFLCCIVASVTGSFLAQTQLKLYLNIFGVGVMLFLAWTALDNKTIKPTGKITAVSLSVAVDAGIACMYLCMCGYNLWVVSAVSALLHSGLMATAAAISKRVIRTNWVRYTRYISAGFFIIMAVIKAADV